MNINIKKDILSTKGLSLVFLSVFILGFFTGDFYQPSSTIGLVGFLIISVTDAIKKKQNLYCFQNPILYSYWILFGLYLLGVFNTDPENWAFSDGA